MVFRKTLKKFGLENFWSESFSIRPSCIESSRFRARVAREACLPRSQYKKEPSSPKSYIEGKIRTSKIEKISLAHNDQGDINRGKKWFSEKL